METVSYILEYEPPVNGNMAVLMIAKQVRPGVIDIVNSFLGEEAVDMWEKLIGKKD